MLRELATPVKNGIFMNLSACRARLVSFYLPLAMIEGTSITGHDFHEPMLLLYNPLLLSAYGVDEGAVRRQGC